MHVSCMNHACFMHESIVHTTIKVPSQVVTERKGLHQMNASLKETGKKQNKQRNYNKKPLISILANISCRTKGEKKYITNVC